MTLPFCLPGRRVICLVGAGISTCKFPSPAAPRNEEAPHKLGRALSVSSLGGGSMQCRWDQHPPVTCPLCLLPQRPASLTSALQTPASMPTWRSTTFPIPRPFLRLPISRYLSVCDKGCGGGHICSNLHVTWGLGPSGTVSYRNIQNHSLPSPRNCFLDSSR